MNTLPISSIGEAAISGFREAVVRAASDPNFNVETVERLAALHNAAVCRADDIAFNVALCAVQAELKTVSANMSNPQTRSKYANYAQLDREVRPIYADHGFSISFTTEPSTEANTIMVVGMLSHGAISRRHQIPVPVDTAGFKGTQHMTRTHALLAAATYGKRALLTLIFNLATDDGPAGGKPPPRGETKTDAPVSKAPPPPEGHPVTVNAATGEAYPEPFEIEWLETDTARSWGEKLIACLREYCCTGEDVSGFININGQSIDTVRAASQSLHKTLMSSIADVRKTISPGNPLAGG